MKYLEARISDRQAHNPKTIEALIKHILASEVTYQQVWLYFLDSIDPSKPPTVHVKFFPRQISSIFQVGFNTYQEAIEFAGQLDISRTTENCNATKIFDELIAIARGR